MRTAARNAASSAYLSRCLTMSSYAARQSSQIPDLRGGKRKLGVKVYCFHVLLFQGGIIFVSLSRVSLRLRQGPLLIQVTDPGQEMRFVVASESPPTPPPLRFGPPATKKQQQEVLIGLLYCRARLPRDFQGKGFRIIAQHFIHGLEKSDSFHRSL